MSNYYIFVIIHGMCRVLTTPSIIICHFEKKQQHSFFLQYVPSVVSEAPHGGVEFSMYNDLNVYKNYVHFEGGCWQSLLPLFQ